MRLYSIKNGIKQLQVLKKYCIQLDNRINALKRFIDNFNANYVVLNLPDTHGRVYYNNDQLETIGILVKRDNQYSFINPSKMITHQVIDNTYQKDLFIYGNEQDRVPQGFAVRHDGYNTEQEANYSIIPLANSGSYYTVSDFQVEEIDGDNIICKVTWVHTENATDLYGLYYLFSLVLPGSRFYYHNEDGLYNLTSSPIYLFNFTATPSNPTIATSNYGLWTTTYVLSHEMYTINDDTYEEVFDDASVKTEQIRVGEYPQSRYIIYTNIPTGILPNLKINLY